jgi:hypothetical protein
MNLLIPSIAGVGTTNLKAITTRWTMIVVAEIQIGILPCVQLSCEWARQ